jgi:hypothetical protein
VQEFGAAGHLDEGAETSAVVVSMEDDEGGIRW